MGNAEPVGAHCPLTTLVHCTTASNPVVLLQVPPGQGVAALEPSPLQYEAIGHGLQPVELVAFW